MIDDIEIIDIEDEKPKKSKKGIIIASLILLTFFSLLTVGFFNRQTIFAIIFDQDIEIEAPSKETSKVEEQKKEISKSNSLDKTKKQLKVINDYINIRSEANADSELLGEVESGEIYTVLSTVEAEYYYWYEIETNTSIKGFIASPRQDVYLDDIDEPYIEIINE